MLAKENSCLLRIFCLISFNFSPEASFFWRDRSWGRTGLPPLLDGCHLVIKHGNSSSHKMAQGSKQMVPAHGLLTALNTVSQLSSAAKYRQSGINPNDTALFSYLPRLVDSRLYLGVFKRCLTCNQERVCFSCQVEFSATLLPSLLHKCLLTKKHLKSPWHHHSCCAPLTKAWVMCQGLCLPASEAPG